ncbi:MAG TPA: lipoprotein-releasing system ATP-binding protein LolD [Deltaproteobacteria bacterium]|nr:MAG: hypothetical protein A2048_02030 [Deltaproteobacteria bacterium GWA2_45_12]HBF13907.1 lipoprotein-releasing system ATP-binding protein LolD [Deltaproteobacteria bacterium]
MAYLKIENLEKTFESQGVFTPVLRGVSFEIAKGEKICIWGASGAGKSTLLHILGALDRPTKGRIFFNNENIFSLNEKQLAHFRNHKLGFIFQFHHLLPDFTALENVMMPLLIRGTSKKESQQRASSWLGKVGLNKREGHWPSQLSGGEQARVALARAVVGEPELVLADEPTGNLDEQNGAKIFDLLLSLNEELKTTLVVVTHNEHLSKKLERKVHLVDGKIQEIF